MQPDSAPRIGPAATTGGPLEEEEPPEEMELEEESGPIIGLGVMPFIMNLDSGPRAISPSNSVPQSLSPEIWNAGAPGNQGPGNAKATEAEVEAEEQVRQPDEDSVDSPVNLPPSGLGGLDSKSEALDPGRTSTAPSRRTARSGRVTNGDREVQGLATSLEFGTPLGRGATRSSRRCTVDHDNEPAASPRDQAPPPLRLLHRSCSTERCLQDS